MAADIYRQLQSREGLRQPAPLQRERPVWIFGAGGFGTAVCRALQAQGFDVAGFVESQPRKEQHLGLPVLGWAAVPPAARNGPLCIAVFNRDAPFDRLASLAGEHGFGRLLLPYDMYALLAAELGWRYWLSAPELLARNADRVAAVAARMADEESRDCIARTLAFRAGADLPFASYASAEPQYFNALTLEALAGRPFTFVDCGAYNGDTFAALLAAPGVECTRAYLLEPDPGNFRRLVANSRGLRVPTVCLPLAAADKATMLSFAADNGEASRLGQGGDTLVAAAALDELLPNESIGFLKLDVEGAEAQVLRGAAQLVQRCRPVLALSLYHNPADLWELPELLFAMCERYRFHVRQHYANSFDSVLYAIPE